MNRFLFLLGFAFIVNNEFITSAFSQELKHCGSMEATQKALKDHPELVQKQEELEKFTKTYLENSRQTESTTNYTIPLVFHIIHQNGPENISDDQVKDAVRILNEDYQMLNADTNIVIPSFQKIRASAHVQFRLAEKDPNGNCTNGIDRILSSLTESADDNSKLDDWPNYQYLNIWVVSSLALAGAAGYAYLPGSTPSNSVDGVLIESAYIGSIGTGNPFTSRALTHEIGHCLNLMHPWGGSNQPGVSCIGDDLVSDTPVTEGWTSCVLNGSICNPPVIENVQNYMDYSYCSRMFTAGQVSRMRGALNYFASYRNNLWSSSNLVATGTDGSVQAPCIADFVPDVTALCVGSSVTFKDLSWNGPVNKWSWTFTGGTPASSSSSSPVIQYNAAGSFPVSLTVSNSLGSKSVIKNSVISVIGSSKYSGSTYSEGFESSASFADWQVTNLSNTGPSWARTTSASSSGSYSLEINNFNASVQGNVLEAISPPINLSKITNPSLTFKLACAAVSSTSSDALMIYVSTDCGHSWILRKTLSGYSLYSSGIQTSPYTPTTSGQWKLQTVNVLPYARSDDFIFKFQFTSGGGNNVYLDDINISQPQGIEEVSESNLNFVVYPNPFKESAVISFNLINKNHLCIKLCDVLGRSLSTIVDADFNNGEYKININDGLKPGIYFVNVSTNTGAFTRKIIVN